MLERNVLGASTSQVRTVRSCLPRAESFGTLPGARNSLHAPNYSLEHGANVNMIDRAGHSPLSLLFTNFLLFPRRLHDNDDHPVWVSSKDKSRLLSLFPKHDEDPNIKCPDCINTLLANDEFFGTILHKAYQDANFESCRQPLEAGEALEPDTVSFMLEYRLR
jgi:hypothetical protein